MKNDTAIKIFDSLASNVRLDVYRLLVKKEPEGMVAGSIASELDIPNTNLSFHLKELINSGLLTVEQEGRFLRYRADIPVMMDLISFLTEQCCAGSPQVCQNFRNQYPQLEPFLPPITEIENR